jgi:hypothetical protein
LYELNAVLYELKCILYELKAILYELKCIWYESKCVWYGRRAERINSRGMAGTGREDSRIVRIFAVIQCDISNCFMGVQHLGVNSPEFVICNF